MIAFLTILILLFAASDAMAQAEARTPLVGNNTAFTPTAVIPENLPVFNVDTNSIRVGESGVQYQNLPDWNGTGGGGSGDVVGPAAATDNGIVTFDGTTGKLIKDSGSLVIDFATAGQGAKADIAILSDGSVAYQTTSDSQTTGFTPTVAACPVANVTVTGGTGDFTLNAPAGTAPTGHYECAYVVNNQSGASRNIVFAGISTSASRLTEFALANNTVTEPIVINTQDAGTTWRYDGGALDLSTLPSNATPDAADLLLCQDVSDNPDTWKQCAVSAVGPPDQVGTVNDGDFCQGGPSSVLDCDVSSTGTGTVALSVGPALTGDPTAPTAAANDNDTSIATTAFVQTELGALTDSDINGNDTTYATDTTVTALNHGETVVCNNATAMNVNVDAGATAWAPGYRVYVLNIGAGSCTIQDGTTVDVTIQTATGFTAVVPQYGGATIIGKDVDEVVVTGGAAQ